VQEIVVPAAEDHVVGVERLEERVVRLALAASG
jgi:hypothetical protein